MAAKKQRTKKSARRVPARHVKLTLEWVLEYPETMTTLPTAAMLANATQMCRAASLALKPVPPKGTKILPGSSIHIGLWSHDGKRLALPAHLMDLMGLSRTAASESLHTS